MRAGSLAIVCFLVAGCASGMPTPDNSPTASPSSAAAPSGTPVRSPTATPEGPGPTDTPAPTSAASMTPSAAPTATPAATPAASPSAAPASLIGGWKRISDKKALSDPVEDVTWTGNRFVATAWDRFIDSEDGLAWHRQARAGRGAVIQAIASGPGGVVATGTLGETRASWWSADGLTWKVGRRAFPYRARGGNGVLVTDVVATDDGWLAVGREDPFCMFTCSADPTRALVWRSSDGLRWTRVDADQKALQGGAMNAVARVGSGYVAVGAIGGRAAIWRSRDGSRWTRVRDSRVFQPRSRKPSWLDTEAVDVAAGPGGIAVVGNDFGCQDVGSGCGARAWWSEDGRTWASARMRLWKDGQVFSVASTPAGFLAVGSSGGPTDGTSCVGGMWTSIGGRTWSCAALGRKFDGFAPYTAAAAPDRVVALGLVGGGWEGDEEMEPTGGGWWRALP